MMALMTAPFNQAETKKGRACARPLRFILKMVPVHPWSHIEDEHSCSLEILRGILARTLVLDDFEADLLTFGQAVHASALNGGDVNEHVRCAVVGLNEAVTLGGIEELHGTSSHDDILIIDKQK